MVCVVSVEAGWCRHDMDGVMGTPAATMADTCGHDGHLPQPGLLPQEHLPAGAEEGAVLFWVFFQLMWPGGLRADV